MKITVPTPPGFPRDLTPEMEAFIRSELESKLREFMRDEDEKFERDMMFGDGSTPPPMGIIHATGVKLAESEVA